MRLLPAWRGAYRGYSCLQHLGNGLQSYGHLQKWQRSSGKKLWRISSSVTVVEGEGRSPPWHEGQMTDVKIFEGFRALRRASPDRRRREGKESAERQKGEKGWKNSRITGFFDFFSAKKRKNSEVCDVNLGTLRDKVPYFWAKSAVVLFISQSSEALFSGILEKMWRLCGRKWSGIVVPAIKQPDGLHPKSSKILKESFAIRNRKLLAVS